MNTDQNYKIIIISSPSGAGKTTLCKLLLKKMKNVKLSVSYTTRNKRLNEKHGKDYFFTSKSEFQKLVKDKFFIETAINFGNYYGSPFSNIKKAKTNNKILLFDIDWKGARKIRKQIEKEKIIDFFILPPTVKELKKRLLKRGRDNQEDINLRLSYALKEISHYKEYDNVLINQNIKQTVDEIIHIIKYNFIIDKNKQLAHRILKSFINF